MAATPIYGPGSSSPGYDGAVVIQLGATQTVMNGRIQNWLNGVTGSAVGSGSYDLNVAHVNFTHLGTAINGALATTTWPTVRSHSMVLASTATTHSTP